MIIVAGSIEVDPAERARFLASRLEVMQRSRAEEGCLEYSFCADPLEAGRVVLFERWASQQSLDAHIAGLRSAPRGNGGEEEVRPIRQSVAVYEISAVRELGG
jgi:quinol monooxygenase YgiN